MYNYNYNSEHTEYLHCSSAGGLRLTAELKGMKHSGLSPPEGSGNVSQSGKLMTWTDASFDKLSHTS